MKKIRKYLIALLAMTMLFGMSLNVSAAASPSWAIKTVNVFNTAGKKVSSATIYTNEERGEGNEKGVYKFTVEYTTVGGIKPSAYVTSSNRGVVIPELVSVSGTNGMKATLTLTAVAPGKATVTIRDNGSKKTKALSITVKSYVDEVIFGNTELVKNSDGTYTDSIDVAVNGKRDLGTVVSPSFASNKKLTYKVTASSAKGISVNSKGIVSVSKTVPAGSTATITVTANDKGIVALNDKMPVALTKTVKVQVTNPEVQGTALPDIVAKGDYSIVKNAIQMVRKSATKKDYVYLSAGSIPASQLVFTSNKPAVATVDASGKVQAVGNGSAVISISPKLGNATGKLTKKVTVKVTTDVDNVHVASKSFEIIANNKVSANIDGKTNDDASNKKVKYQINSVQIDEDVKNTIVDPAAIKQYLTVSAKGVVKAKTPFEKATITVSSVQYPDIVQKVEVKAFTATKSINIWMSDISWGKNDPKEPQRQLKFKKTDDLSAFTAWIGSDKGKEDEGSDPTNKTDHISLSYKINENKWENGKYIATDNATQDIIWKSSKPSVAEVVDSGKGYVTIIPVSNGTAKITATANDGSKKSDSVTVTVKTRGYAVTFPTGQLDEYGRTVVYTDKSTGTLASVVKAAVNTNASNKKVSYSTGNGTDTKFDLTSKKEQTFFVLQSGDPYSELKGNKAVSFVLKHVDGTDLKWANGVDITFPETPDGTVREDNIKDGTVAAAYLLAGEKYTLVPTVTPKAIEGATAVILNPTAIKWKSSNTKAATVSSKGLITAKKTGVTKITATYSAKLDGQTITGEGTCMVFVGNKPADEDKAIDTAFAAELKAQNQSYLGATPSYNAKTNTVTIKILNPEADAEEMKHTGLIAAMKRVIDSTFSKVTMNTGNGLYELTRSTGDKVNVSKDGDPVGELGVEDALGYAITDGYGAVLGNYAGRSIDILLDREEVITYDGMLAYGYASDTVTKTWNEELPSLNYLVNITMDQKIYDEMMDVKVATAVAGIDTGEAVDSIDYDSAKNAVAINVAKRGANIRDEVNQQQASILAHFDESVVKDVTSVTISLNLKKDGKDRDKDLTFTRGEGKDIEQFITEQITGTLDELDKNGITTYEQLKNASVTIRVTYQCGANTYIIPYTLHIKVDEAADAYEGRAAVDEKVKAALEALAQDADIVYEIGADGTIVLTFTGDYAELKLADVTEKFNSLLAAFVEPEDIEDGELAITGTKRSASYAGNAEAIQIAFKTAVDANNCYLANAGTVKLTLNYKNAAFLDYAIQIQAERKNTPEKVVNEGLKAALDDLVTDDISYEWNQETGNDVVLTIGGDYVYMTYEEFDKAVGGAYNDVFESFVEAGLTGGTVSFNGSDAARGEFEADKQAIRSMIGSLTSRTKLGSGEDNTDRFVFVLNFDDGTKLTYTFTVKVNRPDPEEVVNEKLEAALKDLAADEDITYEWNQETGNDVELTIGGDYAYMTYEQFDDAVGGAYNDVFESFVDAGLTGGTVSFNGSDAANGKFEAQKEDIKTAIGSLTSRTKLGSGENDTDRFVFVLNFDDGTELTYTFTVKVNRPEPETVVDGKLKAALDDLATDEAISYEWNQETGNDVTITFGDTYKEMTFRDLENTLGKKYDAVLESFVNAGLTGGVAKRDEGGEDKEANFEPTVEDIKSAFGSVASNYHPIDGKTFTFELNFGKETLTYHITIKASGAAGASIDALDMSEVELSEEETETELETEEVIETETEEETESETPSDAQEPVENEPSVPESEGTESTVTEEASTVPESGETEITDEQSTDEEQSDAEENDGTDGEVSEEDIEDSEDGNADNAEVQSVSEAQETEAESGSDME